MLYYDCGKVLSYKEFCNLMTIYFVGVLLGRDLVTILFPPYNIKCLPTDVSPFGRERW